jgi:glycosyltransferase involved in cell wall biosynthesis
MMDRLVPRVKQRLRSLLLWLAPAGTWRQRVRFRLVRWVNRCRLPGKPRNLRPDELNQTPGEHADSQRLFHWLDFHPHVFAKFPLATTPAELPVFGAWLMANQDRFGLRTDDVLAFVREMTSDTSCGIEALYRRSANWQQAVPNGLTPAGWNDLRDWLKLRFDIADPWIDRAQFPPMENHERGVNMLAHFCYPSGLQTAAKNTRDALTQAGWDVSCRDVPNSAATDLPERGQWLGLHPYPVTIVQLAPEPLGRNAYFTAGLAERPNVYRIGYWYWELETVPRSWARQKDWLNELWAPTPFVAEALRRSMPLPVFDMLPGMTVPAVTDVPRSRFGLPMDRFLFLFAFDMGSTRERKNPEGAIAAFRKAFRPSDPVSLVLKISRGWQDPLSLADLQAAAEPGRIIIIDQVMPPADVFALMNVCDAYISLHRSEGFGLTLAEAMALGKPTIATAYSGNLAFMNDANSLLVAYDRTRIRATAKAYARGAHWAEPSIDDAAAKMRWVVDHPDAARALADRGRGTVRQLLSLEAAGQRMTNRLASIALAGASGSPCRPR